MPTTVKQSFRALRLVLHLLLGILLLLVTGAIWNSKTRLVKRTKQWWLNRITYLMGIDVTVLGSTPNQPENKGILYVSNHVSWIDIPLIGGLQQINFLSKAEVRNWPLIGYLAQGTGTLFINRGTGDAHKVAEQIASYIDEGRSVLFFPEGTTSDGRQVRKFFQRLFRAAEHTEIQLCPVAVHYQVENHPNNPAAFIDDDEFGSHFWNLLRHRNIKATVEFLPVRPLPPSNLREAVRQAHQEVAQSVARLNTNIQSPDASSDDGQKYEATSF